MKYEVGWLEYSDKPKLKNSFMNHTRGQQIQLLCNFSTDKEFFNMKLLKV